MNRNVEIKAVASDLRTQGERVRTMSHGAPELLEQEDTFFRTRRGRLKLRRLSDKRGELIYYERPDDSGPAESRYMLLPTTEPDALKRALGKALGVRGVVRKRREVLIVNRTRVHLDEVDGLGDYIELEAVLEAGETRERGERRVGELMAEMGIVDGDLVDRAYIDLLLDEG